EGAALVYRHAAGRRQGAGPAERQGAAADRDGGGKVVRRRQDQVARARLGQAQDGRREAEIADGLCGGHAAGGAGEAHQGSVAEQGRDVDRQTDGEDVAGALLSEAGGQGEAVVTHGDVDGVAAGDVQRGGGGEGGVGGLGPVGAEGDADGPA